MNSERVLNGRYEVGELIGRGGMADVYLARDVLLGRSVAIKVLRPDLARDPLFQSRFRREAQAVAALNHPAIVSIFDTGDQDMPNAAAHDDVRVPFIVMEYVAGRTIRDFIKSRDLSVDDAIHHTVGILAALEYSHRAGIVHRDIKPANVMITPDGAVKVMDFGIARAMADSAATMTQTQAVLGTAQYLSPEQARGETVDARSDLYSAACVLYEMLASRPPFIGDSPVSVAYQHVREHPDAPSVYNENVSAALDSVLAKALQKDRVDRFQGAADFRDALQRARHGIAVAPDRSAGGLPTEAMSTVGVAGLPADDADKPQTRAMARVRAGGPLTNDDVHPDEEAPAEDERSSAMALGRGNEPHDDRRKRRRAWVVTLFIFLALVLAAGAFVLVQMNQPKEPVTVAVPNVAEMTETEAQNKIYGAGLTPQVEEDFHDSVENGTVIESSPSAGEQVLPDSEVTIVVSKGPSTVVIPEDLAGQTESAVRDTLQRLGLTTGITTTTNSASVPRDRLVSTDPRLGEKVKIDTTVNLVISTGTVKVPNVVDMTKEEAESTLTDPALSLLVEFKEEENSVVEPGTITGQSYPQGTEVEPGSVVEATVATEPEKEPKEESTGEPDPKKSPSPSESPAQPDDPGKPGKDQDNPPAKGKG